MYDLFKDLVFHSVLFLWGQKLFQVEFVLDFFVVFLMCCFYGLDMVNFKSAKKFDEIG